MSRGAVKPSMRGIMEPTETGYRYDRIVAWWNAQQDGSTAGLEYLRRAAALASGKRRALDVGCGSGGRIVDALTRSDFDVAGVDVSGAMIRLARKNHPGSCFVRADICRWEPPQEYDVIVAWDSTFHVPRAMQRGVVAKLCGALADGGAVLFTAGGVDDEITGQMRGQTFYYSSLDAGEYLEALEDAGCRCVLQERDAFPEDHVVFIGVKGRPGRSAS